MAKSEREREGERVKGDLKLESKNAFSFNQKIVLFLLVLFCAGSAKSAWGATWYAWKSGENGCPSCAQALCFSSTPWGGTPTASTDLHDIINHASVAIDDIIILDGGSAGESYTGTLIDSDTQMAFNKVVTLRGCISTDTSSSGHTGAVVIDANNINTTPIVFNKAATLAYLTVEDTDLTGQYSLVSIAAGGAGAILDHVTLRDSQRGITVAGNVAFRYGEAREMGAYAAVISAGTMSCQTSLIHDNNSGIYTSGTGVFSGFNVNFTNNQTAAITVTAGTSTCTNCIEINNGEDVGSTPFYENGGQIQADNCLWLPNGKNPSTYDNYSGLAGANRISNLPEWVEYEYDNVPAYCAYVLDDSASIDDWNGAISVAQSDQSIGIAATVYDTADTSLSAQQKTYLVDGINAGHEVLWHGRSHCSLDDFKAFDIQHTGGPGAAALTVSGEGTYANSLVIDSLDDNDDVAVVITEGMSITELETAINAQALHDYSFTYTAEQGARYARTIENQTASVVPTATSIEIDVDETRMLEDEIAWAKTDLESEIHSNAAEGSIAKTYSIVSAVYPDNSRTANSDAKLLAESFLGARAYRTIDYNSESEDIFNLPQRMITYFAVDDTESQSSFDLSAKSFYAQVKQTGMPLIFWAHGTELNATLTQSYHEKALLALKNAGFQVVALSDIAQWYNANWTTADDITYTRTFNYTGGDFHILAGGYGIDAGTSTSLTTDLAGNPIYGLPDIGAYEYQPPYDMGTNEPDTTADVRVYGDGKFRNVETTGGTTADLSILPASDEKTEYLDVEITTWEKSGDYSKEWTESSTTITGNVVHTIGDLQANRQYTLTIDDATATDITGTDCVNSICTADSNGEIEFTYTGGYSDHTFALEEIALAVAATEEDEDDDEEDDHDSLQITNISSSSASNSITIKWETNNKADSKVFYGTNKDLGKEKEETPNEEEHKITISNLDPDTTYYYKVKSKDRENDEDVSEIHSVKTEKAEQSGSSVETQDFASLPSGENGSENNNNNNSNPTEAIKDKVEEVKEQKKQIDNFFTSAVKKIKDKFILSEIKLRIIDKNNNPIPNLLATIHSDPQTSTTNQEGIITFKDIEAGKHTIKFAYQNETYEKRISIEEPKDGINTIQAQITDIKAEKDKLPMWVFGIFGALIMIIILLVIKRRKKSLPC